MISASHNPYMDNGVKFFSATGIKLEDRLEEELEARIHQRRCGNASDRRSDWTSKPLRGWCRALY